MEPLITANKLVNVWKIQATWISMPFLLSPTLCLGTDRDDVLISFLLYSCHSIHTLTHQSHHTLADFFALQWVTERSVVVVCWKPHCAAERWWRLLQINWIMDIYINRELSLLFDLGTGYDYCWFPWFWKGLLSSEHTE